MCEHCADAASLRQLFNKCAEMQVEWKRNPMEVWKVLYEGIINHTAGLNILAEMEQLRNENRRR